MLTGLDAGARAVLALLDGTRDRPAVERAAAQAGCPVPRARELLDLLDGAGLVVDAGERWPERLDVAERDRLSPDAASLSLLYGGSGVGAVRRRDAAAVLVLGAGRVGAPLAGLLTAAGVGSVEVCDDGTARPRDLAPGGLRPQDVGRARGAAARDRLREVSPSVEVGPARRPDVVVLAPVSGQDPADVAALCDEGVPHLLAEVHETVGVVGPLVLPGRSACLGCTDLARTDRDPDWPALAVQLSQPPRSPAACDAALAAAVSAQAALQVLALLDGEVPDSVGGSLELALPGWRWRRRSWERHDACACRWLAA